MIIDITNPAFTEETISDHVSKFVVTPLYPGYGHTIGNAIRRVLLSSLPGAALTSVRFDGVTHEFSTLPGIREDVVELTLNLKQLRLKLFSDEPVELDLDKKGPGVVTAADFKKSSNVEIANPDLHIATLDKGASLSLRAEAEKGRGYVTVEAAQAATGSKMPLGTIALDSLYSPVTHVEMNVEDTRVGQMTNYDKLTITVSTDGTALPKEALEQALVILDEQVSGVLAQVKGESAAPAASVSAPAGPRVVPDETPIMDSGLSIRIARILETAGFMTVGHVRSADEVELMDLKGLGEKGKQEIQLLRQQAKKEEVEA